MEAMSMWRVSFFFFMFAMIATMAESRQPVLHRVGGGKYTWEPNTSFSEWASHEQFYVGDWLYFGFDKHAFNVLEVNKTNYEKCIDANFITNITRGGRDVFNLTQIKDYYFICGRGGYCFKGMKLAVHVLPNEPSSSAFMIGNGSSQLTSKSAETIMLTHLIACSLLYNLLLNII